jgi:chemotaxis protein methyltransferase CheR
VTFQRLNLAAEATMPALANVFHLIVCRNVMIYFESELIRETVARFWEKLLPGGWLIVGHAEFNPTVFAKFTRVRVGDASVYQKPFSDVVAPQIELLFPVPDLTYDQPILRREKSARSFEAPAAVLSPPSVTTLQEVRDLADRGSWQAAAALGRQLTESEPLSAPAHFTLGLILESIASPAEAEPVLRRAIYLDRNFALAHYHLANCLQNGGRDEQARKSFRNVVQLLTHRPAGERVEHGDGLTVGDLNELAKLHLEILEARGKTT